MNKPSPNLSESEESFRFLVASIVDYSIIMLGPDGTVLTWNDGAKRIKGYTAEEIIGKHFSLFFTDDDKEIGKPARELHEALRDGRFEDLGWRVRKDASKFFANVVITPIKDSAGNLRGFGKITRDITERKKVEEELQLAKDKAVEASRFKSEFLTSMSHEIRTPMNGVIGMTEILLRSTLTESQFRYATTIKESCNSLLSVINDILDFSKIEAGKLTLDVVDVELVKLVEGAAELLAPKAKEKGISLLTFIDPAIPALVKSDPTRLRQILVNFVGNAVKFSDNGEVIVRAILETDKATPNNNKIKFSVTDNGPGMSDEQIANLFQPYVQGDASMTRKHGGTGLGLTISKRFVELMNGEISVHSVKGYGSTFSFTIPVGASHQIMSDKPTMAQLNGARILIVDDHQNAREIVREYLERWGMRAEATESAEKAISMLQKCAKDDPYILAVVDLVMPDTNGLQLGKKIRESDELKKTRLLLVTAFDKPGIGEEAISLGFNAFLTKPIRQSELCDAILSSIIDGGAHKDKIAETSHSSCLGSMPQFFRRRELLLVVEDHPVNQEVALLLLRDLGFEAHIARNGQEALELMKRVPYAAVFMDCQMPVLNGLDATRAIRKSELLTGKHIPIVAMTAHVVEGSREQCIEAGMDDYMSKPIALQQLQVALDKWVPGARDSGADMSEADATSTWLANLNGKYGNSGAERMLTLFWAELPEQIGNLRHAVTTNDLDKLLLTAHGFKGICQTVMASEMNAICSEIENAGHAADWENASRLVSQLSQKFEQMHPI